MSTSTYTLSPHPPSVDCYVHIHTTPSVPTPFSGLLCYAISPHPFSGLLCPHPSIYSLSPHPFQWPLNPHPFSGLLCPLHSLSIPTPFSGLLCSHPPMPSVPTPFSGLLCPHPPTPSIPTPFSGLLCPHPPTPSIPTPFSGLHVHSTQSPSIPTPSVDPSIPIHLTLNPHPLQWTVMSTPCTLSIPRPLQWTVMSTPHTPQSPPPFSGPSIPSPLQWTEPPSHLVLPASRVGSSCEGLCLPLRPVLRKLSFIALLPPMLVSGAILPLTV
ncbi:extensin-like [Haliotis rubra]|uniref:extensin-like n=1 Tax=Haliotis rubra TaxID=36100 RepID=UPI001EE62D7E|nr:extensin-like [Haliotis rubra]